MTQDNDTNTPKQNETSDFLLDEDFFGEGESEILKVDSNEDNESTKEDISTKDMSCDTPYSKNTIPTIRGENTPKEYLDIVERISVQYALLPYMNYDDVCKELSDLSIKSCATPSLHDINDELQKVQASKDRLSEIFIQLVRCHNFKKRAVDILTDAWGKFTEEKNAEGRKGDAAFRLSNFSIDLAQTEGLLRACTHVLKNLDSLSDNLSRRITIFQLISKNQDFGRSGLPDHDFYKKEPEVLEASSSQLDNDGELSEQSFSVDL